MTAGVVLVTAGCSAWAVPAASAQPPPPALVLTDVAGDANGLNDQSDGGLFAGAATPASLDQADLRRVVLSPLAGRVGLRVRIDTTQAPGPVTPAGPAVAYGVVLRLTPRCSVLVQHIATGAGAGRTRLVSDCEGVKAEAPVKARHRGAILEMDVPYVDSPAPFRRGQAVRYLAGYTRTAPGQDDSFTPLEIDGLHTRDRYVLPG